MSARGAPKRSPADPRPGHQIPDWWSPKRGRGPQREYIHSLVDEPPTPALLGEAPRRPLLQLPDHPVNCRLTRAQARLAPTIPSVSRPRMAQAHGEPGDLCPPIGGEHPRDCVGSKVTGASGPSNRGRGPEVNTSVVCMSIRRTLPSSIQVWTDIVPSEPGGKEKGKAT